MTDGNTLLIVVFGVGFIVGAISIALVAFVIRPKADINITMEVNQAPYVVEEGQEPPAGWQQEGEEWKQGKPPED